MASDFSISIGVSASVGGALSGLASVNKTMKTLEATTSSLKRRQDELENSLIRNKDRLSSASLTALTKEHIALNDAVEGLSKSYAGLQKVSAARAANEMQWQDLKDRWMRAASAASALTLPVKLAVDFESSMADVKKVVDFDTPEQFKQMNQDILKMTRDIPLAGKELAKIAASGGQLGIARKDIPAFTETIAKMSVAFDMSADQAGDSMAKLANVYQIPIAKIGKLGDAINHLSNKSPAKAADIVNTLGRVGGVAKQFGLTELQTASLSNAFIALGRTPEVAGTAINGMLTQLMTADKQGKKFQAVLGSMGTDSKKLKKAIAENGEQALMDFLKQIEKLPKDQQMGALVDLFGKEYADDVAALVGGLDTYKKSIEELKKTGEGGMPEFMGSMEKEFAARSATTANQLQLLKNAGIELGISIGNIMLPTANKFLSVLTSFAQWLTDLTQKYPLLTKAVVAATASFLAFIAGSFVVAVAGNRVVAACLLLKSAFLSLKANANLVTTVMKGGMGLADVPGRLGTALRAFSAIRTAIMGFAMTLQAAILPVIAIIAAIGIAAFFIYKYWQPLKAFFAGLWDGLMQGLAPLKPAFDALAAAMAPFGQAIMSTLGSIWSVIQPLVQPLIDWFGDFFNMSQVAEGGARNFGQSIGLWIGQTIASLVTFASTAWANIIAFFSTGIAMLLNLILTFSPVTAFIAAFQAVWTWFSGLGATFMSYGSMMIDGLVNGIKAGIGRAVAAVQGVVSAVKSAFTSDRKGMGIHSPSRVFAGYGGYMTEGLAVGIKRTAGRPLQAVGAWAGRLKDGFHRGVGGMRADLAARISGSSADFAAARAAQSQAQVGGITVNFNPTINAPGGDPVQIQTALQMGLREFEALFNRMMADRERRAY